MSRADACATLGVSRETGDRLAAYLDLLGRWQRRINLVAASTLADPWRRHVLDSGQLFRLAPPGARVWADLGSGAGLPGMVLAILGAPVMHLVESDQRKAAFLREAARVTGTAVTVHAVRVETAPLPALDVVTARALAPLDRLLVLAAPHLGKDVTAIFPKGRQALRELTEAGAHWHMTAEIVPSLSDPEASILVLRGVSRARNSAA
jgi:16S rRNA (guanine527-N7)-methyltransferase